MAAADINLISRSLPHCIHFNFLAQAAALWSVHPARAHMQCRQQPGWSPSATCRKLRPIAASNERATPPRRPVAPLRATRLEQKSSTAEQEEQQPREQQFAQPIGNASQQGTRRCCRQRAALAALAGSGAACYAVLSAQPQLPPLPDALAAVATALLGGPLLVLAAAKAALQDRFHVELHRWGSCCRPGPPHHLVQVWPCKFMHGQTCA